MSLFSTQRRNNSASCGMGPTSSSHLMGICLPVRPAGVAPGAGRRHNGVLFEIRIRPQIMSHPLYIIHNTPSYIPNNARLSIDGVMVAGSGSLAWWAKNQTVSVGSRFPNPQSDRVWSSYTKRNDDTRIAWTKASVPPAQPIRWRTHERCGNAGVV